MVPVKSTFNTDTNLRRRYAIFDWAFRRMAAIGLPLFLCGGVAIAQLPPESALPDPKGTPSPAELPAESTLPEMGPRPVEPTVELPAESELPAAVADPTAIPGLTGRNRPILRLDYGAHTGQIRALDATEQQKYWVTGGDDKDVQVWRRDPRDATRLAHHRTLRWQVNRGPRGRIYALACRGQHVAVAGYGALVALGEICVFDVENGTLIRPLVDFETGHRQVVVSLAWSPGLEPVLASQDVWGQLMTWQPDPDTGRWYGKTIVDNDLATYGADVEKTLRPYRGSAPIAFRIANELVTPTLDRLDENSDGTSTPKWKLKRIDLSSGKSSVLNEFEFDNYVSVLSASSDGRWLVCGDERGSVGLWRFDKRGDVEASWRIKPGGEASCAEMDALSKRLILGTGVVGSVNGRNVSRLQVWDVAGEVPKFVSEVLPHGDTSGCQLRRDDDQLVATVGNQLLTFAIDPAGILESSSSQSISAPTSGVASVAFAESLPYRVGVIRRPRRAGDGRPPDEVFDLSEVSLVSDQAEQLNWLPHQGEIKWAHRLTQVDGKIRHAVIKKEASGEETGYILPLFPEQHGQVTAMTTVAEANDATVLAIGMGGSPDHLYVFRMAPGKPPQLLRQFRGQTASIRSIGVSPDKNYLVSGGDDSTLCVWNMQQTFELSRLENRWGSQFEIEDGQLRAQAVRLDGPLYFHGVRDGDRLLSVGWSDGSETVDLSDPAKVLAALEQLPFDTQFELRFSRLGRPLPVFAGFPAWRPLATLSVDRDREWAFWTPAGFYDASFNGHQRFGWQINRGLEALPDYFRAAQFRKALERPDVMRRLLSAGSLAAAMKKSLASVEPPPGERAIVNQYLTKPVIRVLSPAMNHVVQGNSLEVVAEIQTQIGARLVAPKAFVSGVPAKSMTLGQRKQVLEDHLQTQVVRWQFDLPQDKQLQFELLAATDSEAAERVSFTLSHVGQPREGRPQLHLIAFGVGKYKDPQIQSLDFAADATNAIAKAFTQGAASLYRVTAEQLVNEDATRSLWKIYSESAVERLAGDVSPDDLVVMYLCGHGLRDRRTNQWYFVGANANFSDLMNDEYQDCLSFEDLSALAKLPCRKLAILDSCHSGAVQPVMRDDDLKSALRMMQQDLVITLTASEGDEEAAEVRETGLGRFTTRLIEALSGAADRNGDHVVSLNEAIRWVSKTVAEDSRADGMSQHPTASPHHLLQTLELPLTQ